MEDPSVYNGLSNVVTGVNQNGPLRWLIQNRQKAGSKTNAAQNAPQQGPKPGTNAPGRQAPAKKPPPTPPPPR
ncbi:MAG TPA: hypothetical protein VOA80_10670 [Thermoanaerobaculia bacterium]|nr:hypothetical protein [Thermoanaerobaculia bacterium]